MRKLLLVLLAVLAVSASAQTLDKPTRISVFVSNLGFSWSEGNGSAIRAGIGVALEHRFSRAWSAEVAVASEEHDVHPYDDPVEFDARTYPIDAVVRYSFPQMHTRWRPYLGAGVRYVGAPDEPPGIEYEDQFSPEISGGVEFNFSEAWSVRFDAKQAIDSDTPVYDAAFKLSVGAGWRF